MDISTHPWFPEDGSAIQDNWAYIVIIGGHISRLELAKQSVTGLSGSIPEEIVNLTSLSTFTINNQDQIVSLPTTFS